MGGLKFKSHNGIILAQGERKLLGSGLHTCAYWVDGVVIDTGPRRLGQEFKEFFEEKKVEKVLLTHHHEDHCGNASLLADQGIPVYLHHSSLAAVERPVKIPFYRWLFWGERLPFKARPLAEQIETSKGKLIKCIETPGHAADHLAFLLPDEGALFTGDLFVSSKTRLGMPAENYREWMETLAKLLEHDFDTIYCGHSGIVPEGKKMIAKKLASLQELQAEVLELQQKGLNIKEINKKIFPRTEPVKLLSGGEWDSIHIIRSLAESR